VLVEWPDYCCVPALVENVFTFFGRPAPDRRELALLLGVALPRRAASNPLDLPRAVTLGTEGVHLDHAVLSIPRLLAERAPDIRFRFEPFSTIAFQDYEGAYNEAAGSGAFVGAGLNWPLALGKAGVSKHVVRVLEYGSQEVRVFDPLQPAEGEQAIAVLDFERSVRQFDDGFWIFAKKGI
jgi:hypothetical protein